MDNLVGGPAGDLAHRDETGVLWLYLGKGDGTFATRTRNGSGWNTYDELIGAGDANRDGRPDLLRKPTRARVSGLVITRGGVDQALIPQRSLS